MNILPTGFMVSTPMTVSVGEPVHIKIKALCPNRFVGDHGAFEWHFPRLISPANRSPRGLHYLDNVPPWWRGRVHVESAGALDGPGTIEFDGTNQGVFAGDTRPIRHCDGWRWMRPGIHFITVTDPETGAQGVSNPVVVTQQAPQERVYWGDIHWQSILTDGLRYPEELYDFARDEAFLDFGAAADHAEGLTDRQWEYFKGVANDYNRDGSFATLLGFEWTSFTCGHRNIYYPGDDGPILRANRSSHDTLPKLFAALQGREALVIPHHSAAAAMGVDWDLGWNPQYEKAVEIASIWGSSECSAQQGNIRPIITDGGERPGSHVIDALRRGYRFGFIGSGDIHDGRPGDDTHSYQTMIGKRASEVYPQSFVAAIAPRLCRRSIYRSMARRSTYAATTRRMYMDVALDGVGMGGELPAAGAHELQVCIAASDPLAVVELIGAQGVLHSFALPGDTHVLRERISLRIDSPFCYVRARTRMRNLAWSSPHYLD